MSPALPEIVDTENCSRELISPVGSTFLQWATNNSSYESHKFLWRLCVNKFVYAKPIVHLWLAVAGHSRASSVCREGYGGLSGCFPGVRSTQ